MFLYDLGRKVNKRLKEKKRMKAGQFLSPVRRIEKVAPLQTRKIVAMTFDDGPNLMVPEPKIPTYEDRGVTEILVDILGQYNAKGTFDVVGSTENNYPDRRGKLHTATWGGTRYDHYPDFGQDALGGALKHSKLLKQIIEQGHEIANHGYEHILFGKMAVVYGKRAYFHSIEEVVSDLKELHNLIARKCSFEMKYGRPPHYIDKIPDGYTSYDAYRIMGYQYLAAGYDGGGWLPSSGNYDKDVELMVEPMQNLLNKDPNGLNGHIIFQKDGCNMSKETPIVSALDQHLKLLIDYGYEVVTVSQLLDLSPFEDVSEGWEIYESVRRLVKRGYCIGYKDNTFQPNRALTKGELAMMVTEPSSFKKLPDELESLPYHDVPKKHPYFIGVNYVINKGWFTDLIQDEKNFGVDDLISAKDFRTVVDKIGNGKVCTDIKDSVKILSHEEIISCLAELLIR